MRKICVVTTSRADYGILSNLIRKIDEDDELELQLLVSGTHLSKKFGYTVEEILADGIKPAAYVDIIAENDTTKSGVLNIMSNALNRIGKALLDLEPDLLIVLGDRYEMLAVATAAMLSNIPMAHIHGGESTYALIDEAVRHSITKMCHLHFTTCEYYRNRVIQLGEHPDRVFNVGALGIESIKNIDFIDKDKLDINLGNKNLLVCYQPVTLKKENFMELFYALAKLEDINLIFTMPNSDIGNEVIVKAIKDFVKQHSNAAFYVSLGHVKYLSTMRYVDGVIGNSSSGIIEAPSFGIGTINIGDRQRGRIQADSIINCPCNAKAILEAVDILYKSDFSKVKNPYQKNNSADNIINIIKYYNLKHILEKNFYDIGI